MGANLGRMIGDYRALVETCRARAVELELSRLEIDRLGGLPPGYSGHLLGNGNGATQKRMWPIGLEAMLGALGLKILLIEDEAATARARALSKRVDRSNQRFGNKCNSKRSLTVETVEITKIDAAPQKPAPLVSRAHLRVIQGKRKVVGQWT
jgi:hypothetical protein